MKNKPGDLVHPSQRKQTLRKSGPTPSAQNEDRLTSSVSRYSNPTSTPPETSVHKNEVTGLRQLFETRRQGYARADYRVEIASDNPADTVQQVLKLGLL